MIGWINNSVEAFIRDTFGEEKWHLILQESGHADSYPWVSSCPFSDAITYDIVITGARVLGVTVDQALEAYGVYFVNYVTKQGYMKLLKVLGGDIIQFLENLNNLHLHLTMSSPEMHAPAFRCEKVTPESVELHYYSTRPALWPIVVGVLKGLSTEYFKLDLTVELLQSRHEGTSDHEVFLVNFPRQERVLERLAKGSTLSPIEYERFSMDPDRFTELFPFHILMDRQFVVLQCGPVLTRMFPDMGKGAHVGEFFKIKMPRIPFMWSELVRESNGPFLLSSRKTGFEMKGQMLIHEINVPGCPVKKEAVVFLGSPRCANLDELQKHGLFLSDIALHDMSGDFVLLAEQRQAEADLKERFEKLTHDLQAEKARSDALVQRMYGLLACFPFKGGHSDNVPADIQKSMKASPGGSMIASQAYGAQDRIDVIEAVRRAMGPNKEDVDKDEQIELVQAIGEGTFGKVYRGLWQGTEVAIKTIILPANMSGSEKREKMAIMEAAISSTLSHPNVVQTYTYTIKPMRDSANASVAGSSGVADMTDGKPKGGVERKPSWLQALKVPPEEDVEEQQDVDRGFVLGGATMTCDVDCSPLGKAPGAALGLKPGESKATTAVATGVTTAAAAAVTAATSTGTGARTILSPISAAATAASNLGKASASSVSKLPGDTLGQSGAAAGGGAIHSYEIRLVLEFCDLGSLRDVLDAEIFVLQDGSVNMKAVLDTAMDIAKAMLHLHRNNVLHADLKARNILLRSTGDTGKGFVAKVADFGLSVKMDHNATHISDMCQGTLTHMAPELLLDGQLSKAADVYAYGILLWELYTSGTPYKGTPKALLGHQVTTMDKRPVFPPGCPVAFQNLAKWCWAKDRKVRPIFEEVMQALIQMRCAEPGRTPNTIIEHPEHGRSASVGSANANFKRSEAYGGEPLEAGGIDEVYGGGGTYCPSDDGVGGLDLGSAIVREDINTHTHW